MLSKLTKVLLTLSILLTLKQEVRSSHVVPIIKVVHQDISLLGESPFWDPEAKLLYYIDGHGGYFCRLNPATGDLRKVYKGVGVRVFMPYHNEPNYFLVSRNHQLFKLNFETEEETLIAELLPGEDFNDCKCDTRGRLFTGTMTSQPYAGSLYRLDGTILVKLATPFTITNGFAWSNDANSTRLFLNDSRGRMIYKFDYDITKGTLSNKEVMIDFATDPDFGPVEGPDGMVIDEFGFIWVACIRGGRIVKIDVDLGKMVDQVILPNNHMPTSLAKGEFEGRDGLYITTASFEDPLADDGKILHISFQGGEVNTFVP